MTRKLAAERLERRDLLAVLFVDADFVGRVDVSEYDEVKIGNTVPVAAEDSYDVPQDGRIVVDTESGLLANDSDPDGDSLTAAVVTNPEHGQVMIDSDGWFAFVADDGYRGEDQFTYVADDGFGGVAAAVVSLAIGEPIEAVYTVEVIDSGGELIPVGKDGVVTASVGEPLTARVIAEDVRDDPVGVFTAFADASFLDDVLTFVPDSLAIGERLSLLQSGAIVDGAVDEAGGFVWPGAGPQDIRPVEVFSVQIFADEPGKDTLVIDEADQATNDTRLFNGDGQFSPLFVPLTIAIQ